MEYINKLKDAGFDVKVSHKRVFRGGMLLSRYEARERHIPWREAKQKGGLTRVSVSKPVSADEVIGGSAQAVCSPQDNFCRHTGLKLALARAMQNVPREERLALFEPEPHLKRV